MEFSFVPLILSTIAGLGTLLGGIILLTITSNNSLFFPASKKIPSYTTAANHEFIPVPATEETIDLEHQFTPPQKAILNSLPRSPISPGLFGRLQALSAGVMVLLSLDLLFIEAAANIPLVTALAACCLGFVIFMIIEKSVNYIAVSSFDSGVAVNLVDIDGETHKFVSVLGDEGDELNKQEQLSPLWKSTLTTYIAMLLHNFPEGICLGLAGSSNLRLGISLCVSILLHNVLEGVVVALPLWYTTSNAVKVLFWTLLNGLAEPVGCFIAQAFVIYVSNSQETGPISEGSEKSKLIDYTLAVVAGVMFSISCVELLPSSVKYISIGRQLLPVVGTGDAGGVRHNARDIRLMTVWTITGIVLGAVVMKCADWIVTKFAGD
ncbi:hypothetical protein HK098_002409 [Nowakowskiella sp. JEL0407]|nr:hypothetical protein HK098_002409 [Nowakowskiella sp. JEL0407]